MLTKEKCQICYKRGKSCCRSLPLMTEEEAAEIYFKYPKIDDLGVIISQVSRNTFLIHKPEDKKGNSIKITENTICPFLNKEGLCDIYEIRPNVCRTYGESDGLLCPYKDLSIEEMENLDKEQLDFLENWALKAGNKNIRDMALEYIIKERGMFSGLIKFQKPDKRYMTKKAEKEIMLLLLAANMINVIKDDPRPHDEIKHKYKYRLAITQNGLANAIRLDIFSSENPLYTDLCKIHNKIQQKLILSPVHDLAVYADKLNKLLNGVTLKETKLEGTGLNWIDERMIVMTLLLRAHKDNIKNKLFKDIIHNDLIFKLLTSFNEKSGGKKSIISLTPIMKQIWENSERLINSIMKNQ